MKFFKIMALWGLFHIICVVLFFISLVMGPERLSLSIVHSYFGFIAFLLMSGLEALVMRNAPVKVNPLVPLICGYLAASLYHWFNTGKIDPWYFAGYLLGAMVCLYLLKVSKRILNPSTTTHTTLAC